MSSGSSSANDEINEPKSSNSTYRPADSGVGESVSFSLLIFSNFCFDLLTKQQNDMILVPIIGGIVI